MSELSEAMLAALERATGTANHPSVTIYRPDDPDDPNAPPRGTLGDDKGTGPIYLPEVDQPPGAGTEND